MTHCASIWLLPTEPQTDRAAMLKPISAEQLRLGMYIHQISSAWIEHPFWRSSFKLESREDLLRLRAARIDEIIIDTGKGLDVAAPKMPAGPVPAASADARVNIIAEPAPQLLSEQEAPQARKLLEASRDTVINMFRDARLGKALSMKEASSLVQQVEMSITRNSGTLLSMIRIKTADDYTYLHSVAVCAYMIRLGQQLGLPPAQIQQAGMAGLLHDIGKIGTPATILYKPGKLTADEFSIVMQHPEIGHALLLNSGHLDAAVSDVALHHHEKFDGSGYPHRLGGPDISLLSRMGAVCDVYDALTSNRSYKSGSEPGQAIRIMLNSEGHFDPHIREAFIKSIGIFPCGSCVLMESGRLAIVVDQNDALLAPRVRIFFSTKSGTRIQPEIIDLSKKNTHDRILSHVDPETWGLQNIELI